LPSADGAIKTNIMTGGCHVLFTTLPREIIVEILKELEWHSVLNIRQVSLSALFFIFQASSYRCPDMQISQWYFKGPCCVDKPISSIRGAAHAVGAFGETAGLVLGG